MKQAAMALMAAVLFGGSSPAGTKGDSSWLQGARLVISGGPCAGTYTLGSAPGAGEPCPWMSFSRPWSASMPR